MNGRGLALTDLARDVQAEVVRLARGAGYEQRPAITMRSIGVFVLLARQLLARRGP